MHNLSPLVDIGLTDLSKPGWEIAHSAHSSSTPLQFYYSLFVTEKQITIAMTSTPIGTHCTHFTFRYVSIVVRLSSTFKYRFWDLSVRVQRPYQKVFSWMDQN